MRDDTANHLLASFHVRSISALPSRDSFERRLGGALAGLPGSADRPPQGLVHGLAREPKALAQWLGQRLACPLAAGSRHRGGAKGPGLLVPARRMRAPDRLLHLGTVEAGEPVERKRHHCRLSLRGETGPKPASHIDEAKLRPREVREQRRRALAHGLLKHQIIALQAQRVACEFDRHVVIAAEPKLPNRRNVATPSRQEAFTSRSADLARSIADTSSRSLPHPKGPSTNSIVARQSPRSLGSTCAQETSVLPRAALSMARLQRTRFAKKSSISPSRAYRSGRGCGSSWGRPRRSRWLGGAA